MIIYKYIDSWGGKIIDDRRIKISDPRNFNDPFEFLPKIRGEITDEEIEAKFDEPAYRENYFRYHLEQGIVGSRDDFEKWLEANKVQLLAAMTTAYRGRDYKPQDFREIAARKFGVTCFTPKRDNLLMWAHYADNHKGLVIGVEKEFFGPLIYEVAYEPERVVYSPVMTGDPRTSTTVTVLRTKSPDWRYEEEQRAIIPWALCIEESGHWFYPIHPSAIKEVIFGVRIDSALRQSIIDKKTGDFSHLEFFDALPTDGSFSLEFKPLQ
jgi:Protein of unknown function (DUF2971)